MSSHEEPISAHRSITSSGRPSIAGSSYDGNPFDQGTISSGLQSPSSRVSRPYTMKIDEDSRYRAIIKHLHAKATSMRWMTPGAPMPHSCEGVLIRKGLGEYVTEPQAIDRDLEAAVARINPGVALTMSTDGTQAIFDVLEPHETELMFQNGSQIQIYDSMAEIAGSITIKKFQYAALVRQERILLVWHDELGAILSQAMEIESRILALVWGTSKSPFGGWDSAIHSSANSTLDGSGMDMAPDMKSKEVDVDVEEVQADLEKLEIAAGKESLARPLIFTSSIFVGLAMLAIILLVVGLGGRALILQTLIDHFYPRLLLALTMPIWICLGLYFAIVLFGNLFELVGPITGVTSNSRFHSAIKPSLALARAQGMGAPPITIQMPIYTESLEGVVKPTVASLQAAISYYESRGGTARIFINDDGMAIRSDEDNAKFREFYINNNIGWVSRPKHNHEGFVRRGKFKKASNMNFALNISNRVEDELQRLVDDRREKGELSLSEEAEDALYKQALQTILDADSRAKAGGNIRMGEFILIVDSDTIVPEDCLMYGAAEMYLSPEVAIVQHATGVMQVSWDYFENGITYFTNLVYTAIRFSAGSGEVAPFVGHNAFLRWEAVQSVGNPPEEDGYVCFWSESHVSEDFDIALRLQIAGNIVRLASYHGRGFKEGVSLTIFDELDRWEKYAYGCNELVFNPIHTWLWKGPVTKLFRTFLFSNIQLSSKISICGYIFSYYAIASAIPLGCLNYFLVGWLNGDLDKYYVQSWNVLIIILIVFNGLSTICFAVLRYRTGEASFLGALFENIKWMPFFMIFFGGVSFHILLAICAHMFSINMTWGATAKEKTNSNFFAEMPKIWKRFKWMYMFMIAMVGGMIYLGNFAPHGWEIDGLTSVLPWSLSVVMHCLLPIVLNPSLTVFNY
ncbi:glycosyl transferase family group 2-domain-containing protein, partial [Phaeosphaeria sp. MPI-PUGE-AT-0046c]